MRHWKKLNHYFHFGNVVLLRETPLTFYSKCKLLELLMLNAMMINFRDILQPYFLVLALLVFSCMRVVVCVSEIFSQKQVLKFIIYFFFK